MAYEIPGFTRSYESAADLSGTFLRFVKLSGAVIVPVTAATDDAIGVLQNKPAPNTASPSGTVMTSGVTRCMSGKALAAGVAVYLDTSGRVTDVSSAGNSVGITETACSAVDQVVSVLLKPLGAVGA